MNRRSHSTHSTPAALRRLSSSLLSTLVGSVLCAGGALAQAPAAPSTSQRGAGLGQQCRSADLIFEGVVESLRYRNSDVRSADDASMPHTFVTFRIERVYKGGIAGSADGTLTLRFLGGPDGTGRTLHVSHAPLFEVGSREILLVKNSETWGIPLVGGSQRRFRVVEEAVLSEGGGALEFADGGVRVRPSDKANEADEAGLDLPRARSMPAGVFRAALENLIRESHDAQEFFACAPVATIVFDRPFFTPAPPERAPRILAADLAEPTLDPESRR